MGIARDDKPMRQNRVLRGFRQFDAPVSLVLTYDEILVPGAVCHFDLGALCYVINGQGIVRPASPWVTPTTAFRPTPSAPIASRTAISSAISDLPTSLAR
jgi:hypothetical protein